MKFIIYLYMILFFLGFLLLIFMHESTHVEIYKSYNISSYIDYFGNFPNVATITDEYQKCDDSCKFLQNFTEIIGYMVVVIYLLIGFSFLALMILIWGIGE